MSNLTELFGDVIHSYTRTQALEDGVLVNSYIQDDKTIHVDDVAREAGITFPVAFSQRLWAEVIVPDPRSIPYGQSVSGRLWDALYMLRNAIKLASRTRGADANVIHYRCIFIMKARQRRTLTLKAVCGPGDQGEPVITIMYPEED